MTTEEIPPALPTEAQIATPVGSFVLITMPDGSTWETTTKSKPWKRVDGSWAVFVTGKSGCYDVSRVKLDKVKGVTYECLRLELEAERGHRVRAEGNAELLSKRAREAERDREIAAARARALQDELAEVKKDLEAIRAAATRNGFLY